MRPFDSENTSGNQKERKRKKEGNQDKRRYGSGEVIYLDRKHFVLWVGRYRSQAAASWKKRRGVGKN